MKGRIDWLRKDKGYGCIKEHETNDEHFVHINNIGAEPFQALETGVEVEFTTRRGRKGWEATTVRVVGVPTTSTVPSAPHRHIRARPTGSQRGTENHTRAPLPRPSTTRAPYNFIPIDIEGAVSDQLRFHHGANPDDDCLNGCLKVEWTTLTPTIVGHDQIKAADLNSNELPRNWNPKPEKKALLPLRATWLPNEPVIWPGTSLKGMLRTAISSLLAAPMERVNEHHFTYRPNLDQAATGGRLKRMFGVVSSMSPLQIKLVKPEECCFVDCKETLRELRASNYKNVCFENRNRGKKLSVRTANGHVLPASRPWTPFRGGVSLNTYHHGAGGDGRHPALAIDAAALRSAATINLGHGALSQWRKTVEVMNGGFFSGIAKDDAVVVEIDRSQEIVTFGHYFSYRIAYADSVRTRRLDDDTGFCEREELRPLDSEYVREHEGNLSGGRLLFGFVEADHDKNGALKLRKPGVASDYGRLAGRITCNHALEVVQESRERFVGKDTKYWLALKELGSPKPSAVEHYLDQTDTSEAHPRAGTLLTYGDSYRLDNGELTVENRSPRLRGRKVYPHQAALNEDEGLSHCQGLHTNKSPSNPEGPILENERAMLVRHVSTAGTCFRSSIRYRDLRAWELGALVAAIEPDRFARWLAKCEGAKALEATMKQVSKANARMEFASKLGHARPLGLGSVQAKIHGLDQTDELFEALLDKLTRAASATQEKLDQRLAAWFRAHRYSDTSLAFYPNAPIYGHHFKIRQGHATARRADENPPALPTGLPLLHELP